MSNALALACVTGVLMARVQHLIDDAGLTFSAFSVTAGPPDNDSDPGVYIHLYQLLPDAQLRNATLPERTAAGNVMRPSRLAVEGRYLFTYVGEASSFDSERLAGLVMTSLHDSPILATEEITAFIAALSSDHVLATADLGNQIERVRMSLQPLDLEELSRLWGMYGGTRHRLSTAYCASVVMLDAQVEPTVPLPVTDPRVTTFQLRSPHIGELRSSARRQPVVRFGESLHVHGSALAGDRTLLRLGSTVLSIDDPTDAEVVVPFDGTSGLRAGVVAVQVVHEVTLHDGSTRPAASSNALPVALVADITVAGPPTPVDGDSDDVELRVGVAPAPAPDQRLRLLLTAAGDGPQASSDRWRVEGSNVVFTLAPPASGTYLVRVEVDGAVSLLAAADDDDGAFVSPSVTVP